MLIQNSRFVNTSAPLFPFFSVFHKKNGCFSLFFATVKRDVTRSSVSPEESPEKLVPEVVKHVTFLPQGRLSIPETFVLLSVSIGNEHVCRRCVAGGIIAAPAVYEVYFPYSPRSKRYS